MTVDEKNLQAQPTIESLEALLHQETTTYRQVVDVMQAKRDVLVSGDYHQLPLIDQQLVVLGQKSLALEHDRMGLMQQMTNSESSLQQLILQLPMGDERKRLQEVRFQLMAVVEQIRLLNQDHRRLLNQSIKWVSETLRVVNTANVPEPASYQAKGIKPNASKPVQSTVVLDA